MPIFQLSKSLMDFENPIRKPRQVIILAPTAQNPDTKDQRPSMMKTKHDQTTMNRFDTISPLDYRYYGDDPSFFDALQPYVSETANIRYLLRVELALVRALVHFGICPASVQFQVEAACKEITAEEVYREEHIVHHNIRAIVNCIRKRIPEENRQYVHLFATSNDIMDTAYALRYKELVRDVLLPRLIAFQNELIALSRAHKDQLQIGRTHGQHAVPTTFGYALSWYVSRLGSRIQAIDIAHRNLRGKLSGAVGAYNALSLQDKAEPTVFESEVLNGLGLNASPTSVSTQLVEPEYLTDLVYAVTSCFSVLANLADDIRNLVRTEIAELTDLYDEHEVGSSTMPHKVNPKNFENVKSMWKEFMPRMMTMFMDQISEHQRDLTNSASLRFLPELFTGFCYAVSRLDAGMKKLFVNKEKMLENFAITKDKIVAEPLYIILAMEKFPDAYDVTMRLSRQSQRDGKNVLDLAEADPVVGPILNSISPEHKAVLKDTSKYIGDAPARVEATCDYWELESERILKRLGAERKDAASRERLDDALAISA